MKGKNGKITLLTATSFVKVSLLSNVLRYVPLLQRPRIPLCCEAQKRKEKEEGKKKKEKEEEAALQKLPKSARTSAMFF